MNWLDKAITWVAPEVGLRRVRARRASELIRLAYEGARSDRRTGGWVTSGNSASSSASWLNQVGRWFAEITRKRIPRGSFRSLHELERAIRDYIRANNKVPQPFQ